MKAGIPFKIWVSFLQYEIIKDISHMDKVKGSTGLNNYSPFLSLPYHSTPCSLVVNCLQSQRLRNHRFSCPSNNEQRLKYSQILNVYFNRKEEQITSVIMWKHGKLERQLLLRKGNSLSLISVICITLSLQSLVPEHHCTFMARPTRMLN